MRSSPDYRAFKRPYVQTFVRSKLPMFRLSCVTKKNSCAQKLILFAFMSRLSCVQKTRMPRSSCVSKLPMSGILCVPNQKSSAAILIFCAFLSRLSCFQKTLCRDFSAFKIAYTQIFECSKPKTVRCTIGILCVFVEPMLSKDLMSRL